MIFNDPIIVIGGSAAGAAAAAKAARVNPKARVLLFEKSPYISTGTCELPYLISGKIDDYQKLLFFDAPTFTEKKRVDVFVNTEVLQIHHKKKQITVKELLTGRVIEYKFSRLIIATGAATVTPPEIHPSFGNVFTLKNIPDYLRYADYVKNNKCNKVAVIGGGFIGLEVVSALRCSGKEVVLVEKKNRVLPAFMPEISRFVSELLLKKGIEVFLSCEHTSYFTKNNQVTHVKIDGRAIEVDAVFITAGFMAENKLFGPAGIKTGESGAAVVTTKMLTTVPDIYAAGDCIEVVDAITKQRRYIPSAVNAQKSGHIAGENAAGGNSYMRPTIHSIALPVFDRFAVQVGCTEQDLAEWRFKISSVQNISTNKVSIMPGTSSVYAQIHFEQTTGNILSASFFGGNEVVGFANLISMAILQQIPVQNLHDIPFCYTPDASPLIHPIAKLGNLATKLLKGR